MGAIHVIDKKQWVVARWVFRYLAEALSVRQPRDSKIRNAIENALRDGSYWFSIEQLNPSDKHLFRQLVGEIYDELSRKDASEFATVQGYEGLKKHLGELFELLKEV